MERVQYTTSSLVKADELVVTTKEAKDYLGIYVDSDAEDGLIKGLIAAATSFSERYLEEFLRATVVVDYFSKLDKRLELSHSIEETSVPVVEVMLSSGWTPYTGTSTPDRTSLDEGLILEVLPITLEPVTNPVRVKYNSVSDATVTRLNELKDIIMFDVRLRYEGRSDDLDPRRMSLIPRRLDQLKRHNSWMTFSGVSA